MKFDLSTWKRNLWINFSSGFKRYPAAILSAILVTFVLILINHYNGDLQSYHGLLLKRLALILALGFPVALCLNAIMERSQVVGSLHKILYTAIAAVCLWGYFTWLLPGLQPTVILRYVAVTVSACFMWAVIPCLDRKHPFERFIINLLIRLMVTVVYAMVLYLGLIAILFAINTLFSAGISNRVNLDLFLVVGGVFGPLFFLSGIPKPGEDLRDPGFYTGLKILLLYILIPLIAVYTLILYAYFAKILFTHAWPEGMVVNLVLWYAFLSLGVVFLIFPMKNQENLARSFILAFPKAVLPLLLMMFAAIGIRISHFGFTEERYFVMVAGIWIFAYMTYLAIARNPSNILLAITFSAVAILSVSGPWSAFSVSAGSQNSRFEQLLVKNNMLQNGVIVKSKGEIPEADRKELSAILSYFADNHALTDIRTLPKYFNVFRTEQVFGFRLYEDRKGNRADFTYFFFVLSPPEPIGSKGFDYFSEINSESNTDYTAATGTITINYSARTRLITVCNKAMEIYRGNVGDMALAIARQNGGRHPLDAAALSKEDQNSNVAVRYQFRKIRGSFSKNTGNARFELLQFYFLIHLKTD